MFDNDNPKVIVDDDFLDLRDDQSKYPRVRPHSAKTRISSPFHPQGNANTIKEVFPGLKRIINNFNQINSKPSYNNQKNILPVDSRFRRKIEKKIPHFRPESIKHEGESTEKIEERKNKGSESSDLSTQNNSVVSEKQDSIQLKPEVGKLSWKHDENENFSKTKEKENCVEGENKKIDEIFHEKKELEEKLETILKISRDNVKKEMNDSRKVKKMNMSHHRKMNWRKEKIVTPQRFYFKKSWTIPSIPLIQRSFSWTRNPNILCNKVDRETYEFDTDDTISDSEENISLYSTISRSNYMNMIFCLGCLCGIFLIGGILTASEIQVEYFKPMESDEGMLVFFYEQISYTIRVIFSICYQILTFPTTTVFRIEQPHPWRFFKKFLYFLPE